MSSYDDTFDKSQFALYDYDATNNNVKDLCKCQGQNLKKCQS